jgi:acyl carrier protein
VKTSKSALQHVQESFRDYFLDDDLQITETTSPETLVEWDSMAQIGILTDLEEKLDVQFSVDEMGSIASVNDLVKSLTSKGI